MDLTEWTTVIRERSLDCIGKQLGIETVEARGPQGPIAIGFPGVLPLWGDESMIAALIALPDVAPRYWPGILLENGQAVTLATDSRTLLPRYLLRGMISNFPDEAKCLSETWAEAGPVAFALHAELGGEPRALQVVADVLASPAKRERFKYRAARRTDFEAAHGQLARAIDPSAQFHAYADWFDRRLAEETAQIEPDRYGAWARQALTWSFVFERATRAGPANPRSLLPLVTEHSGLDTGMATDPTWARPNDGASDSKLLMIAQTIQDEAVLDDPVDRGLVKALATMGFNYDGYAHAEAVVALDERGEGTRAWGALNAAAWWMARRFGQATPAILDGARLLCDQHGWNDVRWVVDHAAEKQP